MLLLPLTKESGTSNIIGENPKPQSNNIGFDPRWTPANLLGSVIFSGDWIESYIDIDQIVPTKVRHNLK